MRTLRVTGDELSALLRSPYAGDDLIDVCAVLVPAAEIEVGCPDPGSLPVVVIGLGSDEDAPSPCDLVVDDDDSVVDDLLATIRSRPLASATLAVLLRTSLALPIELALAAESSAYSLLQSGPEFSSWLAARRPSNHLDEPASPVIVTRIGREVRIELNRPHRHNAFSAAMRDSLAEALALAASDLTIDRVDLLGRGPSFCSGGDLAEFGSFPDPATAHRVRLVRSNARLLSRIADRTTVHLHGACIGAGIELAAFASTVVAHPDARISLPEVSLGLVPGAGGTVSLPRRIGRHRTAFLALTGRPIDTQTALAWGLVDEVADVDL